MRGLTLLLLSTLLVAGFAAKLSWWTSGDCSGNEHDLSLDFSKCLGLLDNGAMANESNNQITFWYVKEKDVCFLVKSLTCL